MRRRLSWFLVIALLCLLAPVATGTRVAVARTVGNARPSHRSWEAGDRPLPEYLRVQAHVERHLQEAEGEQRLNDWLDGWLRRLLARFVPVEGQAGSAAQPVWWVVLVAGIAGVTLLAWGTARSLAGHGPGAETEANRAVRTSTARPQTPAELLESAGGLSRQGQQKEAVRTAHLAVLKHLDRLGLLRYDSAQTHREHERQLLRRNPGLARRLRSLNSLVEDCIYSGRTAVLADFVACKQQVDELWREGELACSRAAVKPGAS